MKFGIDILRHLFVIAVIIQHMESQTRYSSETNEALHQFITYVDGAVVGFFFISGYLFRIPDDFFLYVRKRAVRLLVPYFVFSVIYTIMLFALGKKDLMDSLENMLLVNGPAPQLYFLPYLLLINILYSLVIKCVPGQSQNYFRYFLILLLIVLCVLFKTAAPTGADYRLIFLYSLSFVLGATYSEIEKYKSGLQIAIGGILAFVAGGFFDRRFFAVAGVAILFLSIRRLSAYLPDYRIPGSGGIYLMHTPIVNFLISTLLVYIGIGQVNNIIGTVALTYLVCLVASLAFIRVFPNAKWLILE